MTDDIPKKEDIDLNQEIEQLDAFLHSQEEEFPIDDGDDEILAASPRQEAQKSGFGKYVSYIALLAVLGGGGYGAYLYGPSLLQNSELQNLQNMMNDRSQNVNEIQAGQPSNIVPQNQNNIAVTQNSIVTTNEIADPEINQTIDNELPLPSDEIVADLEDNDFGFGADPAPIDNNDNSALVEESAQNSPAETIAEALEITQNAIEEGEADASLDTQNQSDDMDVATQPSDDIATTDMDENADGSLDDIAIEKSSMTQQDSFLVERIPASPILKRSDQDLAPLSPETVDMANDVMDMPSDELIDVVEAVDDVVENAQESVADSDVPPAIQDDIVEIAAQEAIDQMVEVDTPLTDNKIDQVVEDTIQDVDQIIEVAETEPLTGVQSLQDVEAVIEKTQIPAPPVAVEVKKAEPLQVAVPVKRDTTPVVNNKPLKPRDARVTQAKQAFESGDFASALTLYQAVLADNPANTAALTGQQLAKAKMRMQQPASMMVDQPVQSVTPQATSTTNDPRSAPQALETANDFAARGDKDQAMEWYRKALQLDVVYSAGLDRMAIYDAMAALGQ